MTDEPLTVGEIAANLLGAQDTRCLLCAWVDKEDRATWYKTGSTLSIVGLLHALLSRFEDELMEDEEEDDA
ncbi:MAG: hypothetical protein PHO67_08150 [Candidatus Omnitrophica bacterium]|nr:hypothetical protein [Candidatus Omnitrophota bacterium]